MRRVIVLDRMGEDDTTRVFRTVFWYPIPAGLRPQYVRPADYESVLASEGSLAPTAAETTALRNGSVVEEVDQVPLPTKDANGVSLTEAAFKTNSSTILEGIYTRRLQHYANYNPFVLRGTTYSDESGWVVSSTPKS